MVAVPLTWVGGSSMNWNDPANWAPNTTPVPTVIPGRLNSATFDGNAASFETISANPLQFDIENGAVIDFSASTLTVSQSVDIGPFGTGSLTVTKGSSVIDFNLFIGASTPGGSGTIDVVASTLTTMSGLIVGEVGTGTLAVGAGGLVDVLSAGNTSLNGVIDVSGGGAVSLGGSTGTAGAVTVDAGDGIVGRGTINGDIVDNGTISAGFLAPGTITIDGNVSGSGVLLGTEVGSPNGIDLGGSVAATVSIDVGPGATMTLELPRSVFGVFNLMDPAIGTLVAGSTIDVTGLSYDGGFRHFGPAHHERRFSAADARDRANLRGDGVST